MKIQISPTKRIPKKQVSFRVDTSVRDRFRYLCNEYNYNQSNLMEQAIKEIIKHIEREQGISHE